MSGQELATRFAEAMAAGDPAALGSLYAQDATFDHVMFPERVHGRDRIVAAETPLFEAFSDISVQVRSVTGSDRKVAFEWSVDATNTGPLPLPDGGTLPATGRRISLPGLDVAYLDDDGLIAEGHRYQDVASFMAQLGLA
ncbi:MAG: ester cyclase [Pseudonocardia sp.]|nr:ester cyclase [Pseudonocardia sp.]